MNERRDKAILRLYQKKRPIREISRKLKISREKIRNILNGHKVLIRGSRDALLAMEHFKERKRVKLTSEEKAYLYGLVMGDLTPVKHTNHTLKLITHTTHPKFIQLLKKTFNKYGHTKSVINKVNEYRFQTFLRLDDFKFLFESKMKKIPQWILTKNRIFLNFLSGYIDADGSVYTKKSGKYFQCVIRMFGENLNVLKLIRSGLKRRGYHPSLSKTHPKGKESVHNGTIFKYNADYFTLELSRRFEVLKLLNLLKIRHPEKIARRKLIFKIKNKTSWSKIEKETKQLRRKLQKGVLKVTSGLKKREK